MHLIGHNIAKQLWNMLSDCRYKTPFTLSNKEKKLIEKTLLEAKSTTPVLFPGIANSKNHYKKITNYNTNCLQSCIKFVLKYVAFFYSEL